MGGPGPLLQIIQPAAPRHAPLQSVIHKIKQPPQILPKPPGPTQLGQINFKNAQAAHQNALLFNQMQLQGHHGQVPMLLQQQTSTSSASSGVQLILRSPSPSQAKTQQQQQQQRLLQSQQQQIMRLISSGSLQLQQIQTSSGPTFIAVPTQAALHSQTVQPQPATSPKKIKQTKARKKRDEEQGSRLDLANLMRLSGIEEEDVSPTVLVQTPTPSPKATPPPPSTPTPPMLQNIPVSSSMATGGSGLPAGLRLSLSEDGRSMVVHPPTHQSMANHPANVAVTASVAATAQVQLNELLAQHGSNILQNSGTTTYINTAGSTGGAKQEALLQSLQVLSWSGSAESLVMKSSNSPGGLTLGTPGVVIRRPSQGLVLNDPRYIATTDLSRVQLVANTGTQEAPRYQLVSAPLNNVITEQNRQVHIVTNVPQPSQPQHRVIEEQHQTSTTQSTSAQGFNKVHVVNEQQQRLQITSTLLEQQRVEILNEDQKVQLTSLLSTEQQKHITNLLNVGSGTGNENVMMLNQQDRQACDPSKLLINSDGTVNQAGLDLVNFQKNNLLNQKILINNEGQSVNLVNNQSALDLLKLNQNNQLLNEAIMNQNNLLLNQNNQKVVINNADVLMNMNKSSLPAQKYILNNGTLINTSGSVDLKELLQNQQKLQAMRMLQSQDGKVDAAQVNNVGENNIDANSKGNESPKFLLNNIVNHSLKPPMEQNHVNAPHKSPLEQQVNNINNIANNQQVNSIGNQKLEQLNGQRLQKQQERPQKTYNDVYAEHLQAQGQQVPVSGQYNSFSIEHNLSKSNSFSIEQSQKSNSFSIEQIQKGNSFSAEQSKGNSNAFSIEQPKPNLIYISEPGSRQTSPQQHSPQSQQSQNKFLEQQHVNNLVFNSNSMTSSSNHITSSPNSIITSNSMTITSSTSQNHLVNGTLMSGDPSPSPSPTPMSFIPSKPGSGPAVINDHTNRLQIVMDKPPTPTPSYKSGPVYMENRTGLSIVQMGGQAPEQLSPQLSLANKQQLQIVLDSQDNSQIALNDHQNRLQIVMNQPSPESTTNGALAPPITPPSASLAPPTTTRLNGTSSTTHVQFVSPRTVIKSHLATQPGLLTSSPQLQPHLVNSPILPTLQSHPHLTLQPHTQPNQLIGQASVQLSQPSQPNLQQDKDSPNSSNFGKTPVSCGVIFSHATSSNNGGFSTATSSNNVSYSNATISNAVSFATAPTMNSGITFSNAGTISSGVNFSNSVPISSGVSYCNAGASPVFVNRPNLTVLTQSLPSDASSNQVPFRSMPQVCDISPTSSINSSSVITPTPSHKQSPPTSQSNPLPPVSAPGYNSFLDSIAQAHPSIVINKTPIVPSSSQPMGPAASIIVKKPPVVKKSAVVKPMVMVAPNIEEAGGEQTSGSAQDGHPSSGVVQRVQTIQLTPQKQQHLKAVQNQITSLSAKDNKTSKDQQTLQKLYKEQQSILLSGKIVPTIPGQHAQGLTFVSTPVRLVAPPTVTSPPSSVPTSQQSKSTSPICVQVGTQTSDDSKSPPPIVNVPEPPTPSLPSCLSLSKRVALIEQQALRDIQGATCPDTRRPFTSVSDAVKRLVRYHCLDDPVLTERDLAKADEIFEATAQHLLDKKSQMMSKYSYLLYKESMRQVQTSELIMLGRMFVSDESSHLESLRHEARQPPPPPPNTITSVPSPCIDTPPSTTSPSPSSFSLKRERSSSPPDEDDLESTGRDIKRRVIGDCDEEINAQVQSAIDSILNLQRSDPATDEAVRSILSSGVSS